MNRDYHNEYRNHETQNQILLRLFMALGPLSFTDLAEQLDHGISAAAVAGNCGELRSKGWVERTETDGTSRMQLTVSGTDTVRKMFPSA